MHTYKATQTWNTKQGPASRTVEIHSPVGIHDRYTKQIVYQTIGTTANLTVTDSNGNGWYTSSRSIIRELRQSTVQHHGELIMTYEPRIMAGSCRTATDKQGRWVHAVKVGGWDWEPALCGKAPGIKGNGWSDWHAPAITCPKCLAKLAKEKNHEQV